MGDLSIENLLFLLDEGLLNFDEFLILESEIGHNKSPQLMPDGPRLNFSALSDEQCFSLFRYSKCDVRRMINTLRIPSKIVCKNNSIATGLEAFCITLRRFAYPNRLADLVPIFGRSESELSLIFNSTLDFIYATHGNSLNSLNQRWIQRGLPEFTTTLGNLCPLPHCWGFIDGTLRPITRPSRFQEITYSGHKRIHGLKFQSVVTPNGLIANLAGPFEGKRHDAAVFRESGLGDELVRYMNSPNGEPHCLYGDAAYAVNQYVLGPVKGIRVSPEEAEFNRQMSAVRQCVEWGFNKVIQTFAFLDYKKKLKLYLQPVGKYYAVGAFLTNCHTCLYGSPTTDYFGIRPPSLEQYINNR